MQSSIKQAIILAGGLGTRLKSVVADKPKVLSPVASKPFLSYIIQYLQKQGVTDYIFSLGYLANQVQDFLKESYPNLSYQYYIEETPLGTGGGIRKAIEMATAEDVVIVNADTYFDVPLQAMYQEHVSSHADCTVSLKAMTNFDRYGTVELDGKNIISSFKEKKHQVEGLINGGYLILKKKCFLHYTDGLPEIFSFEKDFLEVRLNQIKVKGFIAEGYFIDIGIPEDFAKAQNVFADNSLLIS